MKSAITFMISWLRITTIENKKLYANASCKQMHWEKVILHNICYQGGNQPLLTKKSKKRYFIFKNAKKDLE